MSRQSAAISRTLTEPVFFPSGEHLIEAARESSLSVRLWFCDGKVYHHWKWLIDTLRGGVPVFTLEGGEGLKTLSRARWLWKKLYQYQVDRGQAVGFIGGGALLDLGGFCAATWKRGIGIVSIPTTLIAQVDAAIGGKTGINFRQGKNLIGVFAQPQAIWVWPGFLESLPLAELRSGWVEVFKHSVLSGGSLWESLQEAPVTKPPPLELLIEAVRLKLRIVREDPFEEKRWRYVLNLGHTLGHVWETLSMRRGKALLHGEAVAIGLAQEAYLSWQAGYLSEGDLAIITNWLEKRGYLQALPPFTWEMWQRVLAQDKKVRGEKLLMPLLRRIGEALPAVEVAVDQLQNAVRWYRGRYGSAD